jgi:hypothetical protein
MFRVRTQMSSLVLTLKESYASTTMKEKERKLHRKGRKLTAASTILSWSWMILSFLRLMNGLQRVFNEGVP